MKKNLRRNIQIIKNSLLFNEEWYLEENPDVKNSKMDAATHYLKFGWMEGRDPSPEFSGVRYLSLNPDVNAEGICPLLHYELFGRNENRVYWNTENNDKIITYWKERNKLKTHDRVHYTCIIGGYDQVKSFDYLDPSWDYVLFTDNEDLLKKKIYLHWQIRPLQFAKMDNVRNARWHKIHPHLLFPEYTWSMWQDSNTKLKNNLFYTLAEQHIANNKTFSVSIHPDRDCIYDEAEICIAWKRDNEQIIRKQVDALKSLGFPKHFGLTETFILLRKHKDEKVIQLMEDWWWWIEHYSRRDQLSLSYVCWKNHFSINIFAPKALRSYTDAVETYRHVYTPTTNYNNSSKVFQNIFKNYKNYNDLKLDILKNIKRINFNIDLIVGVPRSGIIPAYMLGAFLHKPVKTLDEFVNNIETTKGDRMKNIPENYKDVLILDDSVNLGNSLNRVKSKTIGLDKKYNIKYAAIYATDESKNLVDFYFEILNQPRVFEWNYLKSGFSKNWCFDIDGVLCVDPTEEENDDGEKYRNFLLNAKPLYLPKNKIGAIATSRLEKYRKETETWLAKNNILYDKLYMLNLPSKEERIKQKAHTKTKIEAYKENPSLSLFIESNRKQAEIIAKETLKPVICVETGEFFLFDGKTDNTTELNNNKTINCHDNDNYIVYTSNVIIKKNIMGKNNKIIIKEPKFESSIDIFINGDGNTIEIGNAIRFLNLQIKIGSHVKINNSHIVIKDNFSCGNTEILIYATNCFLEIGEDCMFATGIHFRLGEIPHLLFDGKGNFKDKPKGIKIGNHVWIGENSYILKNANIADGSIVACASCVTKTIDKKNVVVAGNPAKIRKKNIHWERNIGTLDKNSVYYKNLPPEIKSCWL